LLFIYLGNHLRNGFFFKRANLLNKIMLLYLLKLIHYI